MRIQLHCTYYNVQREKVGEPGDILELPRREAERLVQGGSATQLEPLRKSERD